MISCNRKGYYWENSWSVIIPYEVNNNFFVPIHLYTKEHSSQFGQLNIGMNNFGADVEFSPEKLDQLYHDFDMIEQYLNELMKIIPLPDKIGIFDGYYVPGFIVDKTNPDNEIYDIKDFLPSDILLIISLIKKKILEAKEKQETLVFSGD